MSKTHNAQCVCGRSLHAEDMLREVVQEVFAYYSDDEIVAIERQAHEGCEKEEADVEGR